MTVEEGRELRDEGMDRVARKNAAWLKDAYAAIIATPPGTTGLFEVFRLAVVQQVGEPTHPNAWGSIANSLVRQGYLAHTGTMAQPTSKKSHACKKPVMIRTEAQPPGNNT